MNVVYTKGGLAIFFGPGTVRLNWAMNCRKRKLAGRDVERTAISDKSIASMSVLSYIHCKVLHIQNLMFCPFYAASPAGIRPIGPTGQSVPA